MKVLLVGGGGREHALAWKLSQSKGLSELLIAPGNPGTVQYGTNVQIKDTDKKALVDLACEKKVDLVVVGPEDPLADGLVDALQENGIKAFGPNGAAAALEADKGFSKKIMRENAIPTAEGITFDNFEKAKTYIASRDFALVVKATGLAKGKGVFVCDDPSDALLAAERIMNDRIFGEAGASVLVEEKLIGQETSILAFVDNETIYVMESAQDHKPIGEGDTGPNTGGMGAYSPTPIVTEKIMKQIELEVLIPVVNGMKRNGTPYRGVLYAGLMLTAGGPKVLEFNARFGDPETQPILWRLQNDLLEVMLAVCDNRLGDITPRPWDPRPAICVVMSSGGYPDDYEKGKPITGIEEAEALGNVKVFHAGTSLQDGQLVTSGGRVLGVTALGDTIEAAQKKAYQATDHIHFDGAYHRRDIADKAIKVTKIH